MIDIRTKQGDVIFFINALSDYIDAKIDYERPGDREYRNADPVFKTGALLEQAIERLIDKL